MPTITESPTRIITKGQIKTGLSFDSLVANRRANKDAYEPKPQIADLIPSPFPDIIPVRPPYREDQLRPIKNLLIANRATIAGQALRSALDAGIPKITLMVWEGDRHTLTTQDAIRLAHTTNGRVKVVFAGDPTSKSPADVFGKTDLIVETAQAEGCDRVDLGVGFLSENHKAIKQMEEAGLISVGPTAEQVEAWGDKANALRTAEAAGVPVLPWVDGTTLTSWDAVENAAKDMAFPLMLKPNNSGSGRGIKIVTTMDELQDQWNQNHAMFENNGGWHLTRMLTGARHVELQIMGDKSGKVVVLGERECSVQRKHQKQVEEAAILEPSQKEELHEYARVMFKEGYSGPGTVEFLMDKEGKFYFMEMNTRLQESHEATFARARRAIDSLQVKSDLRPDQVYAVVTHGLFERVVKYAKAEHQLDSGGHLSRSALAVVPSLDHGAFTSMQEHAKAKEAFYDDREYPVFQYRRESTTDASAWSGRTPAQRNSNFSLRKR